MSDDRSLSPSGAQARLRARLAEAVLDIAGHIPHSKARRRADPLPAARRTAAEAAAKAAIAAGSLALPRGPLGWLTLVPELLVIWRIQRQMVADIAALYGHRATLTREQMIWCLFRHTAAQAVRDLVVQAGERFVVQKATGAALAAIAGKVGARISHKGLGSGLTRWLPVVGAIGVGAYAWADTAQVATAAIELFSGEVEMREGAPSTG